MEQKSDVPGFYKIDESIAINKDNDALSAYKKQRVKNNRIERVIDEVESMKNDIQEIKQLLKGLIK